MKKFIIPEVKVQVIDVEDVITASLISGETPED